MKKYDAAIIGFGKGGKTLAGALAAEGQSVALIEQSPERYGGTCINVACIPTKALVHAAELSAAQGGTFAQQAERYAAAHAEKNRVVSMLRAKNYDKLANLPNVDVIDGRASFLDENRIALDLVEGRRESDRRIIEADRIFINTGSRPFVPSIPGIDGPRVHTSETLLDLSTLPKRLVILGGGYIGLEFASLFANFGSHVTIVQNGETFLPREDADIAHAVLASLTARGLRVMSKTDVLRIEDAANEATVVANTENGEQRIPADAVLVATGRRPNIDGLNLEAARIETNTRGGIQVDEHLRTTAPNVWALGDVTGGPQFTYISLDDFRIVRDDAWGSGERTTKNRGAIPYAVFLDPPFARVGMTEQEAREAGFNVKTAQIPAAAVPKAQAIGKTTGLLKAIVDASTDRLLGVHLFIEESHEMINVAKLAIDAGLPYQALRDAVYTHPTMTEAFNDLFSGL